MNNYEIRKIEEKDYSSVMVIEKLSFVSPWTLDQIKSEIINNQFANFYVLEMDIGGVKQVVGFYDYWVTFDSATIAQIAVHPDYRRQHLASMMMQEIIDDCYAKRVSNITLEVRENNKKACKLYQKFGFEIVLIKPHYYENGDDAYYMVRKVNLNG